MIHQERSMIIDAPPHAVWTVLARYMHIDKFAPTITSVEALTDGEVGLGSKRCNHFVNGTSVVEKVTGWKPGSGYTVQLSEMRGLPLDEANSEIRITPEKGKSKVTWTFEYNVKHGLLGWLKGQTTMKMYVGKILYSNLQGLAEKMRLDRLGDAIQIK